MADNREMVENIGLVMGFGYDNATLAEHRHPTRDDLDAITTEYPIYLIHQSGHLGAANSMALEILGITADTKDPPGGVIRHRADGEPDGVLEETAHIPALLKLLTRIGPDGARAVAKAGADLWARYGYTTGQEGRAVPGILQTMQTVSAEGGFKIDIVAYPDVLAGHDQITDNLSNDYENRFRVAGAKLTIDGSPQGFTAWRDRPYYDPVGDYPPGYVGYPAVTNQQVIDEIDWAYKNNIQILVHSNGEAASDLLIAAIDAAQKKYGPVPLRPVLIHGQFLREDQVDAFNRLGVFPSLFPMHTFYWGDWHRESVLGPERAENISPTGWVLERGMIFGTHHDAPVALPNSMRVLSATVTRKTRSGRVLGPEHRVAVDTALKAMTLWPAWQHFEEQAKGSIEVGKLADFVILSDNPLTVPQDTLADLEVLETVKEGVTIYRRPEESAASMRLRNSVEEIPGV